MIGIRALASTIAAACVAVSLGPRVADPTAALGAERLLVERAVSATAAIDLLRAGLEPGLTDARRASAAVVAGDEDPEPLLEMAADSIAGAEAQADAARRAMAMLNGARNAWRPGLAPIAEPALEGDLTSIGEQLRASAGAAADFVDLRVRAIRLPGALQDAIAALEEGDLAMAEAIVVGARADLALVAEWEAAPSSMPVWAATTDAMIGAVERIIEASRAGDATAADAAAEDFAGLADEAATADRALRIGLGEGGSAITAAPLERLAAAIGRVEQSRAEVAAIAAGADR